MTGNSGMSQLSDELDALGYLMHRGESNPRSRSGIVGLQILDTTPDWQRFLNVFDDASRKVLRLRQKVVVPTLPTASPRWVVDPDFDLGFHVRRVRVAGAGTFRDVLDLAEVYSQSPLDISRPLWTVTLVEGLADQQSAVLLRISHAVTDGVGGVDMFSHIYDTEREGALGEVMPVPVPQDLSPNDLMRSGVNRLPAAVLGGVRGAVSEALQALGRAVRHPQSAINGVVAYASSAARVVAPPCEPSPLLARRSLSTRSEAVDVQLADLRAAAKAAGGSINDAYLAALCGAMRMYHEKLGLPVSTVPMAVPVNLRTEADPAGGNHFAGAMLAAPVGEVDPAIRIREIRAQMAERREEPAINLAGTIAPIMSRIPGPVVDAVTSAITPPDVQASNVPMYDKDIYLAGAKVLRQYGLGPLPGVAMMVVLVSLAGCCTITVRYDRASVTEEGLFAECLRAGVDEVVALGGPSSGHCVLVSSAAQ